MLENDSDLLTVTDLKQFTYCPRIFYYHHCLPALRPLTFKMKAGIEAGRDEVSRANRRSLHAYGLDGMDGERYFDVPAQSAELGLTGIIDEVAEIAGSQAQHIPVDYKLARRTGYHFKIQIAAYAIMLEETYHLPVHRGFLYLIPLKRAEEVRITPQMRRKVRTLLDEMQTIIQQEIMPPPPESIQPCMNCEFRRLCNDV